MEMKPMSQPSWKNFLHPKLFPGISLPGGELPRIAIVGIGNEFNGDDAAGVLVVRRLLARKWSADAGQVLVIDAGQAPENITAELRRFRPRVVLMIDAAQMDLAPGQIAWIDWETTTGMSASSHSLPLSMLARYLEAEFSCSVHLLGIQALKNDPYSDVSIAVQIAVDEISQSLCANLFVNP